VHVRTAGGALSTWRERADEGGGRSFRLGRARLPRLATDMSDQRARRVSLVRLPGARADRYRTIDALIDEFRAARR
jgi:hypothetical protein